GSDKRSVECLDKCRVNGQAKSETLPCRGARRFAVLQLHHSPGASCRQPQIRLYSGIGQNLEKCALLKSRELRAARFVRKFLYKNSYAPKAACICELLLGFFEKCARSLTRYLGLYFDCDSGLYF